MTFLRKLGLYAVLMLLATAGFVWAGLQGHRLLGDDNESTENLNGSAGARRGSGYRGGHSSFYHK
ncbi:hypothetical protein EJV47_21305 [Hymenobacter gummosus]|uniref:Uncharacterized protein n=1 Tax=Hymenobacter gummosus TaxID=1776032 RepID=A0A3S0K2A0_9BACT|nr:hypothetical protein [Hymenobacter gummosus]RTQ46494.1 hypothetical protein EJV47_21305 [Hymenobacter gummosus]